MEIASKFSKKIILFLWIFSVLLNIITFLFVYYKISPSAKTLALHYNVVVGVDWYGKGRNLYAIPAAGAVVTIVNFTLYRLLERAGSFTGKLAAFTTFCVQLILFWAALFLSNINV